MILSITQQRICFMEACPAPQVWEATVSSRLTRRLARLTHLSSSEVNQTDSLCRTTVKRFMPHLKALPQSDGSMFQPVPQELNFKWARIPFTVFTSPRISR